MKYYYSKSKFSSQLFYKDIQLAILEHTSGLFQVSIIPYLSYGGKYHIHSVVKKDRNRTIYLTMRSDEDEVDFDYLFESNKFYVSLSHDGRKAMIFDEEKYGIILKS